MYEVCALSVVQAPWVSPLGTLALELEHTLAFERARSLWYTRAETDWHAETDWQAGPTGKQTRKRKPLVNTC